MAELKVGFYGHVRQYHNLRAEIDQAIHEVLESGTYVLGPQVEKFEEELARTMNQKEAVGVNSGTDALLLVFVAQGIGPGDEVITVSNTFFATAEAIWLAGATPVFVEIDPRTRNIDVAKIEAAITPRTRAIVPVHLYGLAADMRAISRIARAHKLFVIEDCAQAIAARGNSFTIGELSDAVCLSFIIQKNLGCFGDDRDGLQSYLASRGVTALTHYPVTIHQQEGFPWGRQARLHSSLPSTERSAARVLSLPMFPELRQDELRHVAESIKAWVASSKVVAQGSR